MVSGGRNLVRMEGQRFGALTVIRRAPGKHRQVHWICRCDCGSECVKRGFKLRQGRVKSCGQNGCSWWDFKPQGEAFSRRPEYRIWEGMRRRCEQKTHLSYPRYGGAGVKVCSRWKKFENFFADMGPRPSPEYSIDRYPNQSGNYEPGNCRWATKTEQQRNKKNNVFVEYEGERMLLLEVVAKLGVRRGVIYQRLKTGWPLDEALTTPVRAKRKNKTTIAKDLPCTASS